MADACSPLALSSPPAAADAPESSTDEADLRAALKRCSPATQEAAHEFRRTGNPVHLPVIVRGVIARYVDSHVRGQVATGGDGLRLVEDLGIDSLTMMEIVLLAEEVLRISISDDELRGVRTLGDVHRFMLSKVLAQRASAA